MSKKKDTPTPETPDNVEPLPNQGSDQDAPPAARESNEIMPTVDAAASTITGCSDKEIKNFKATLDFACRQLAVLMADEWKEICKTARHNGVEDVSAGTVSIGYKIDIDHTNLLLHDTEVTLSFSKKHKRTEDIQEDLTQTTFLAAHG